MIESKVLKSGKRVLFTIFTQGLLSVAAIVVGFGLPKFLPIEEYSRWQVFYFYVAYVNYLQFGFNDGLVLNFSGQKFEKLPWNNIRRATFKIILYQVIGLGIFLFLASYMPWDYGIIKLLVFSCIPTVLMCILSAVLLAGTKTYEYNLLCLMIRLTFVVMMLIGICASVTDADFYMWADIISKSIIVLGFYIYEKRYIPKDAEDTLQKPGEFIAQNCAGGITIASTILLLGLLPMCGRVVIQVLGNEVEYAMFSFAISMLSIILTFTNAIGTVAFPMLKNVEGNKVFVQHHMLKKLYDEILWICLWAIVVINVIVKRFLQEYIPVLEYFPILLAICWPLGKVQSIIYPYYKIYRKEKEFLKICIWGLVITFVFSFLMYPLAGLQGLAIAAFAGVMLTYLFMDIYFEKKVVQSSYSIEVGAHSMLGIFLLTSMALNNVAFAFVYGGIVAIHLWIAIRKRSREKRAV